MADSLLKRVAAGDVSSMQACMEEYGGLVWSLARRYCASAADAEDAVQEVFISLWENAERFDESKGAEVTFVAMIARRRLIDSERKRHRRERVVDEVKAETPPPGPSPLQQRLEQTDDARRALEAIEQLSENQRQVLQLAIHQGLTHEEIARATEMPLGTVKTHARRGLMKVRELLAESSKASEVGART